LRKIACKNTAEILTKVVGGYFLCSPSRLLHYFVNKNININKKIKLEKMQKLLAMKSQQFYLVKFKIWNGKNDKYS